MQEHLKNILINKFGLTGYFLRGSIWLIFAQIVSSLSSFVLAIVLSKIISKEIFGEYRYLLSLLSIISLIAISGYNVIITQIVAQGDDTIWWRGVKKTFLSGILGSFCSFIGAIYYLMNGNSFLSFGLLLIGLLTPLYTVSQLYTSYLSGKKDFKAISLYGIFPDVFVVTALIITAIHFKSAIILLGVFFISNILSHGLTNYLVYKKYPIKNKMEIIFENKYPLHLSAMNLFYTVGQNIDKLLIFHYLGAAPVAILTLAQALPLQLKGVQKIILSLTLPKFSENQGKIEAVRKKIYYLTGITAILIAVYIPIAPFIYKLIFPNYIEAIVISQIFSLSVLFLPCIYLLQSYLSANTRTKVLYINTVVYNFFMIISTFIGVYFFGLIGAAMSSVVSNAVTAFNLVWLYKKDTTK